MEHWSDPAMVRVGVNLGSAQGIPATKLLTTLHEVLARSLNLMRLALVAAPALVQCFFIHSVDFVSWLSKLVLVYVLMGAVCFIVMPDQLYNGMGMGMFRWAFEIFYPEIARSNGSLHDPAETTVASIAGKRIGQLAGMRAKLRWQGSNRYLCLTHDGWTVTGDEKHSCSVEFHNVYWKDRLVPDTYTLRILAPTSDFHECWLSFKPVNHLRFGGWLAAYPSEQKACPYKVVRDSSCPADACKLLCAWTNMLPPSQRSCTGFYVGEQRCRDHVYIGHAADRDAAALNLEFE